MSVYFLDAQSVIGNLEVVNRRTPIDVGDLTNCQKLFVSNLRVVVCLVHVLKRHMEI